MNIESQILLILIIVFISIVGLLVILKNSHSYINISFAIFLFGATIFITGFLLIEWKCPFNVFDKTIHYGGLIILFGLFTFSQVFPDKTSLPKKRLILYIPFAIAAFLVIPFNLLIKKVTFNSNGEMIPSNGPLLLPYMIFWGTYFLISVYFFTYAYRKTEGNTKMQMKYLFTGIIVVLCSFFIFDLALPMFGIISLISIGPISSVILVGLTAYAIIRHRLLDIRIVIQRGVVYLILISIIVMLYVVGLQFFAYYFHKITNESSIISAGLVMILGIIFFNPLEKYFRKITDTIFYKDGYEYADIIKQLSKALNTNIKQTDVIKATSHIIRNTLRTSNAVFVFKDGNIILTPIVFKVVISIPIIYEETQMGSILLGPKLSGDPYTQMDIQLLETFAYQAAVALEKGRLYEKVEEYNTKLENLVEKRTLEIKKLQEDQRDALIDISHNLQTPLAIVKGEIESLVDTSISLDKILSVKRSINQVSLFIRQLLHLSKLDHSAFEINLVPINLSALILEQIEFFEVMALNKNINMINNIRPKIIILGSKKLLSELLTNLISNAIKYRSIVKKDRLISVSLLTKKNEMILSVSDNGVGIRNDDLPGIFTRYYRGSRKQNTSGTGLGLAISKRIVDRHNGKISVDSSPGKETVFTIVFPLYGK